MSSTAMLLGCFEKTRGTGAQTIVEPSAAAATTPASEDSQITAPPLRAVIPPANLSPGLTEVLKLAESGVSEEVLMAYVENSNHAFNPTVDEIVFLKDIGISDAVVSLMVRHENTTIKLAAASSAPELTEVKSDRPQSQTNYTGPSLIDPNAPSYSVAAEPVAGEAAAVVPSQDVVNVNYFEDPLSPYGNWVDVPDYGRCWQPTVVVINRNWRPYADRGRWLYTSSGWYWQSDYSWGWAPFHYGRWHCDNRIGWVWVPGSTWGPAWVSWRYTDDHCGWAPLPPSAHYVSGFGFYFRNSRVGINFDFGLRDDCYTFIPTSRFCERTPSRYYVWGSHARPIYHKSVVVNNYIRGNNNTIVNEGIGRERIVRATHTPIRTVSLRELPTTSNPIGRAERLEGNSLTVFRPNVSAPSSGRSGTQRSIANPQTARTSITQSRSLSSVSKNEAPGTVPPSTPAVAPIDPAPKSFSPTIVRRNPVGSTTTPKEVAPSANRSLPRSVVTTRATPEVNIPSRNWPARSTAPEVNRSIEHRGLTATPKESPRTTDRIPPSTVTRTPITREIQPAPVVRSAPNLPQIQRTQPPVREARREQTPTFNSGEQRSLRSITPSPVAPAPVQNFSPSREISRGSGRTERSTPPAASQPRPSALAPSVRQSAPRQETPARERIERSTSGRSERRS